MPPQPPSRQRRPVSPGRPPAIAPRRLGGGGGGTLDYATPPPPRKPWLRRARNWLRYHVEDRVGNAIMWIVGPIVIVAMFRPFTTMRILRYLFGGH